MPPVWLQHPLYFRGRLRLLYELEAWPMSDLSRARRNRRRENVERGQDEKREAAEAKERMRGDPDSTSVDPTRDPRRDPERRPPD